MGEINFGSIRRVVLAAVAMIAAVIVAGCSGLPPGSQPPSVTVADFALADASRFEQQFNLSLRIQNPNPDEFTIDGMAFDLEVNDQPFARGVGNERVTVPRYGSALMAVEAVSTLGGLLRQFGRLAQGERPALKYRIKGVVSLAGGARMPFEQRGEFDFGRFVTKP